MASVAICPHCYLQLVVPDGIEPDERVECPTCAKEFGLDQAVLRAIPEVVRRQAPAATTEVPAEDLAEDDVLVDEVAEVEESVSAADDEPKPDVIEQIKAQIDSEIAANRLPPGTSTMLPLELPPDEALSDEIGEHLLDRDEDHPEDFSHRDTVPELPSVEELLTEASEATEEPSESAAAEDVVSAVDDHADAAGAESASEPLEERATQPTVRTLSDWMPPSREIEPKRDEPDELADVPGPSFDLPNVPLTPNNGPTVEFDPDMSVGPAAESEFALDDVDFDAMSDEAAPVDEEAADEPSVAVEETIDAVEESAPVFQEPTHGALPATPFVLPGVPPVRKKRTVVRTLVGTALGGVVGTLAALYILLYLRGPGGDLLHVAPYLPNAMLPASFSHNTTQVADATNPAPAPQKANTEPADTAVDGESTNVQAGYVADATPPAESTPAEQPKNDDRYGTEPSPLEVPTAEPISEDKTEETPTALSHSPPAPLPIQGPTFTVEQLATALEAGTAAQSGLITGDLNDASVRRTKGMSYAKMCDLAEAVTFLDRASPSIESSDALEGADRLFRETLSDPHTRSEVARIAQIWIDSPHRAHGGIFLAGELSGGQIVGDVYQYELTTDDGNKLALLTQEPLNPAVEASSRPVGIVGSIVEHPAEQIAGYHGTAERAIWVARAIPLD